MTKRKLTDVSLPPVSKPKLPYNGAYVKNQGFSFSFACFDHTHELFNLGSGRDGATLSGNWFIDLLDCLKNVSTLTVSEMKRSMHDLHPVDWSKANASMPENGEQYEYWQFRINKSRGRVIGFLIDGIFYIVWLDPHHNLTDSEGYGTANYYPAGLSQYQLQELEIQRLQIENTNLKIERDTALSLLDEQSGMGKS